MDVMRPKILACLLSGLVLIALAVVLFASMNVQSGTVPTKVIDHVLENLNLTIPSGLYSYNVSLSPSGRENYEVNGSIVVHPFSARAIMLWVVNETGFNLLLTNDETGIAPNGFPPSAYALVEIEDSNEKNITLRSDPPTLTFYDGTYYFYFENSGPGGDNASLSLDESWTEMKSTVKTNMTYLDSGLALALIGVVLLAVALQDISRKRGRRIAARAQLSDLKTDRIIPFRLFQPRCNRRPIRHCPIDQTQSLQEEAKRDHIGNLL